MPSVKITVIIFLSPGSILTLFLLLLVIISCIFVLKCRSLGHNIQTIPAVQPVQSDPLRLNSNIHSRRPSGTSFDVSGASSQTREEKERMKSVKKEDRHQSRCWELWRVQLDRGGEEEGDRMRRRREQGRINQSYISLFQGKKITNQTWSRSGSVRWWMSEREGKSLHLRH